MGKYEYIWVWTCCNCGEGGMSIAIEQCPNCGYTRCTYCAVQQVKGSPTLSGTRLRVLMESARLLSAQFKHYAFSWRPEFGDRQTRMYAQRTFEDINQIPAGTKEDIIQTFVNVQCEHDVDRYLYQTDQLTSFLEAADELPVLQDTRRLALIDDRNNKSHPRDKMASGERRESSGPMTAQSLYTELLKSRIGYPDQPDAERRLIYITDLEPSCALAIAATAAWFELAYVRDFMYKYLASRAGIGVQIPSIGKKFCLEFHIPYCAWRNMAPITDKRRFIRPNGRPLRQTEEVIHLEQKHAGSLKPENEPRDFIHEAQISVMITGVDDWFWTTYSFVDIHFKESSHIEQVEKASEDLGDPHCCRKSFINNPIWDPREYFLRLLTCRMEQVKQEWSNVVYQLFKQTEPYIYGYLRGERGPGGLTALEMTQREGYIWTILKLRQLANMLSRTIEAWETFKDGEIRYFNPPDTERATQATWGSHLAAIDRDVVELRRLYNSLQHQTELFENMTNSLVAHASHRETIIMRLQSEVIRILSLITIIYLPATLACSFFSINDSILPPKLDIYDWAYTLIALLIGTLFLASIPYLPAAFRKVTGWLKHLKVALGRNSRLGWLWKKRRKGGDSEAEGANDSAQIELEDVSRATTSA